MADALCGPSNPLQNFQKATSADKTLQRDRLRSRIDASGARGFRSYDPRTGSLDAEFAAFEAGPRPDQTLGPLPQPQLPQIYSSAQPQVGGNISWAADFQRLRLSEPTARQSPVASQPSRIEGLSYQPEHAAGWHNEFMKHQKFVQSNHEAVASPQHNLSLPFENYSTGIGTYPQLSNPGLQFGQNLAQPPTSVHHQSEEFDEAAFAAAFAEATSSELKADERILHGQEVNPDSVEQLDNQQGTIENLDLIGSDRIPPPEKSESADHPQQERDADDLARTAGALLDSVKDNESEKFQQSQFLSLMRRLRDREATVRGDDIVDTAAAREEVGSPFQIPGGIL
ncbi:MAG: hypothetical protein Q9227_008575 [Pyrenula ochraceoflavens]